MLRTGGGAIAVDSGGTVPVHAPKANTVTSWLGVVSLDYQHKHGTTIYVKRWISTLPMHLQHDSLQPSWLEHALLPIVWSHEKFLDQPLDALIHIPALLPSCPLCNQRNLVPVYLVVS
jgi:hypothetical protein